MKIAALALLASGMGTAYYAGMPPERFQTGEPIKTTTIYVPLSDLPAACGTEVPEGKILLGCYRSSFLGSVIILPDPCPLGAVELYARIACHEISHQRGWSGDHEP